MTPSPSHITPTDINLTFFSSLGPLQVQQRPSMARQLVDSDSADDSGAERKSATVYAAQAQVKHDGRC